MAVLVLPSAWNEITGGVHRLELPARDVAELLIELQDRYPGLKPWLNNGLGGLPEFMNIFVGNDDIRVLQDLATPLSGADEVLLIPIMSGGAEP